MRELMSTPIGKHGTLEVEFMTASGETHSHFSDKPAQWQFICDVLRDALRRCGEEKIKSKPLRVEDWEPYISPADEFMMEPITTSHEQVWYKRGPCLGALHEVAEDRIYDNVGVDFPETDQGTEAVTDAAGA